MIHNPVTGIVLAGGKSSRMGTDKAMLLFDNKTLIQHAVDILRQVCDKVVISANNTNYDFTGCEVWPDELPVRAPIIGLYSCLKRSSTQWNILLSCDMPLVDPRLFEFLLSVKDSYDLILPVHGNNYVEPLCALYSREVLPALEKKIFADQYGLKQFALGVNARPVEISTSLDFYSDTLFTNVNTSDDFDLLNKS